ncbi:MAG: hypothetical protein ACE5LB_00790 [Acidiferrobacterales bacterium]
MIRFIVLLSAVFTLVVLAVADAVHGSGPIIRGISSADHGALPRRSLDRATLTTGRMKIESRARVRELSREVSRRGRMSDIRARGSLTDLERFRDQVLIEERIEDRRRRQEHRNFEREFPTKNPAISGPWSLRHSTRMRQRQQRRLAFERQLRGLEQELDVRAGDDAN